MNSTMLKAMSFLGVPTQSKVILLPSKFQTLLKTDVSDFLTQRSELKQAQILKASKVYSFRSFSEHTMSILKTFRRQV